MMGNRAALGQLDLQQALFGVRLSDLYTRERLLHQLQFEEEPVQDGEPGVNAALRKYSMSPLVPWSDDPFLQSLAGLAVKTYSLQLDTVAGNDITSLRILTDRAQAFVLLHEFERAHADVAAVLAIDNYHPRAMLLESRLRFYEGNLVDALSSVKRVSGKESAAAAVVLAEILLASGELEKPGEIYKRIITTSSADDRSFERARLIRIYSGRRQPADVDVLKLMLTGPERATPLVVLTLAEHELMFGDAEKALASVEETYETADSNAKSWLAWQAGRILYMAGKPLSASDWYERAAPQEEDSLAHREYVHALFKAQLMGAAHRRARAIRALNGDVVVGITEIEANCLLNSDTPEQAKELLDALAEKQPYLKNQS